MKRRSFIQQFSALVAAVAIAPEICFRTRLALPAAEPAVEAAPYWIQTSRMSRCVDDAYIKAFEAMMNNPEACKAILE